MRPRSILITGCSSGIGLASAEAMQARGWQVFAACRKQADCDRLKARGLDSPRLDVEDPASLQTGLAEVLDATGGTLDALFNSAGYGFPALVEDLPRAAFEEMMAVNLFGVHDLTRRVLPVMRAQGAGRIVMCSSALGLVGMPFRAAYTASKMALEGYTDVLRQEVEPLGLRVVLIEPGPITSTFKSNAGAKFAQWVDWENSAQRDRYDKVLERMQGAPKPDPLEKPASAVVAALARAVESPRPRARYQVGVPAVYAALARRFLPARWHDRLIRRI